jgi:hypothetical protein
MSRIILSLLFVLLSPMTNAAPFDVIVPSEIQVSTPPFIVGVGTPWGWIIATDKALTRADLDATTFVTTVDDQQVQFEWDFHPGDSWTPMLPGDVAGLDVTPFTDPLRSLLRPSESLNPASSNFWRWEFRFPPELTGDANLNTTMTIGGHSASFATHIAFGPDYGSPVDPLVIVAAQRVTAVPEPGTLLAMSSAVLALAMRFRRRKMIPPSLTTARRVSR